MERVLSERLDKMEAEQAEQRKLIGLAIELMCPKCGPAAIVRMHPELGPQPRRLSSHDHHPLLTDEDPTELGPNGPFATQARG